MPGVFYILLDHAAGSIGCMNNGTFRQTALSTTVTFDGIVVCLAGNPFATVVTPCTKPADTSGAIPTPCQLTLPAGTMSIKVLVDGKPPVTEMMPQFSATNGLPSIEALTKSTTVKVL